MINSILAHMRSDDDLNKIILLVPLTPDLLTGIKKCSQLIQENNELISSIKISGEVLEQMSFPSEQFANTFRSDLPDEDEAIVIRYALKALKRVWTCLEISKTDIMITAVDDQDFSYGFVHPVYIPLKEVIK